MGATQTERATINLTLVLNKNGGVTGQTVGVSVYDPEAPTNKWLNMGTGAWQPTEDQDSMSALGGKAWVYEFLADLSNARVGAKRLFAFYEITAGTTGGVTYDELVLSDNWHTISSLAQSDIISDATPFAGADVGDIQGNVDTGVTAWVTADVSALSTAAALQTVDDEIAAMQADITTGVTEWVTATGFATEAKQDVIDAIVDQILVDTTAGGDGPWTTGAGASLTVQDIVNGVWDEAIAAHSLGGSTGLALSTASSGGVDYNLLQAAVWEALAADYVDGLTMGGLLNGAGAGNTPEQVALAVWAQSVGGSAGTFGYLLDDQVSLMATTVGLAALDVKMDDALTAVETDIPATLSGVDSDNATNLAAIQDRATSVELAAVQSDVTDIQGKVDTGVTAWVTADVSGLATAIALATVDGNVDTLIVDVDDIQAKVTAGVTDWVTAVGFATDTQQDIINGVVDAILVQTTDGGPGPWLTGSGGTAPTVGEIADAVWDEASAGHLSVGTTGYDQDQAASGGAGVTPTQIAQAVWDADETLYDQASSMGELLHGAGGGSSPGAVADAVWSTVQSAYVTPGTFGFYVDGQITDAGDPAAIADAVWEEAVSGHLGAGSTGASLNSKASQATVDLTATAAALAVVDGVVDQVLADTSDMQPKVAVGESAWETADVSALSTAAAVAAIDATVDAIEADTTAGGPGPWTTAATVAIDAQDVRDAMLLSATGGEEPIDTKLNDLETQNATLATQASVDVIDALVDTIEASTTAGGPGPWQTGAGGSPTVYASAVWGALKSVYNDPDTFGEMMNEIDMGNLDTDSIIAAINAGVSLVINSIDENIPHSCDVILPVLYTGQKGTSLLSPVYRNGTLMTDSELANSTQLSMEINNITTGEQYDKTVGVTVGPTGHVLYTTMAGDDIFEVAGKWQYQASGLTEQGEPFVAQLLTVRVYNDLG